MIAGVCVLVLVDDRRWACCSSRPPWHAVILPLTITAMILTLAYNPQFALLMSFSLTLIDRRSRSGTSSSTCWSQMGGLATAILLLRNVRTRTQLVAGRRRWPALAYAAMTVATGLLTGQTWRLIAADAGRHFLWGMLAGFLAHAACCRSSSAASASSPTSACWSWPTARTRCLQELVRRAPGTYTHSMTVATLAEAAAEAIGANPLLVRVGSYFHDIGKMLKPQYFIENQTGENRHDELEPALSTLVIIGHVKDGLALAEQYRLPRPIIDFIEQHHGTTLVEYFYREAMRLQENAGTDAGAGGVLPLSRPEAAEPRERHRHAGRRRREHEPVARQPDAGQPAASWSTTC